MELHITFPHLIIIERYEIGNLKRTETADIRAASFSQTSMLTDFRPQLRFKPHWRRNCRQSSSVTLIMVLWGIIQLSDAWRSEPPLMHTCLPAEAAALVCCSPFFRLQHSFMMT